MKQGLSYIALVCDRSGSMAQIRSDAEGGVRNFIKEQKDVPGEAILRLVEFDAPSGILNEAQFGDWYHVVFHGNIQSAPEYELKPRGNTALLDAVGRCITEVGEELAKMSEDARPEHVYFVIQTDGQENSSRDWKLDKLKELVERQQNEWNWKFVFLGMGIDTFAQGFGMGIQNVTRSAQSGAAYGASYANTSKGIAHHRATGDDVYFVQQVNATVDADGNVVTDDPDTIRKDREDAKTTP